VEGVKKPHPALTGSFALCYNAADMADLHDLRRSLERASPSARRQALEVLQAPLPPELVPAVRRLAQDSQAPPGLRLRAWELLEETPPQELRLAVQLVEMPDARIADLPPEVQGAVLCAVLETEEGRALEVLEEMWRGGRLSPQVLERLGATGGERLAQLLVRWLSQADPPCRKALRRALHRLRARGVRVEAPEEDGWEAGYLSHIDPRGSRLVLLLRQEPPYGVRLFQLILNDLEGIQRLETSRLRRVEWQKHLLFLYRRPDLWLVEAEPAYCRALIGEVHRRVPLGEEHRAWATQLLGSPELLHPHPAQGLLRMDEGRLRALWPESNRLLEVHPFAGWRLPLEELEGRRQRVDQARHSPLILSPEQQRQRLEEALAEVAEEVFSGERLRLWCRRLEEMAYVLVKRGDRALAELALSAAWALERYGPGRHPFLLGLLERSLEGPQMTAGLIVVPTGEQIREALGGRR